MHLIVVMMALLVFGWAWTHAQAQRDIFTLKRNHLESLYRLDEQVRVSLPPLAGELVSAAIDEEIGEVL